MTLRLDWASHAAARHACENWHYARAMPKSKTVKVGVWEGERFVGVVIFSKGATFQAARFWGCAGSEIAELTRVALREHETPVSRIIAIAIRLLRQQSPGLRALFSYADPREGHHGGIYQALGWVYTGRSDPSTEYLSDGRWYHGRAISLKIRSTPDLRRSDFPVRRTAPGKHRYVLPLDAEVRALAESRRLPYPKRDAADPTGETRQPVAPRRFDSDPAAL